MSDEPIRLKNAQQSIRDAFFEHERGLYTLNCVPGAGKSEVTHHIAAEYILRRYIDGDLTPEQRVAVISFNSNEAASIIPEICDRLRDIVEHNLIPIASDVSSEELEYLLTQIRRAPFIGTIDSILRGVLGEIHDDLRFEEMPVVGSTPHLKDLHGDCYRELCTDQKIISRIESLESAYPEGDYDDDLSEMLETAVKYCRNRRISTEEFQNKLKRTFEDVYADGNPESFGDVVAAITRCVGGEITETSFEGVDEDDKKSVVEVDMQLHESWGDRIEDLGVVLDEYRRVYRQKIRELGVVSHTDVAYLVDAYFDDRVDDVDEAHRQRIRQRYHTRIQSWLIDEAQDVSLIQHAALSHLITRDNRVFCSGDLLQSIYLWRDAEPTLFETAIEGKYLGIDWGIHEHRTATTTYRCTPDVASAINEIAEPALTDQTRGDFGNLNVRYPGLDADRDGTDEPNVHIAAFDPVSSDPDSYVWMNPDERLGEATTLATLISKGLADGTFTDASGDPLGITVLFRWSSKMEVYEETFGQEGLSVRNASEDLFECETVELILNICEWLVDPADKERLVDLVTECPFANDTLEDVFEYNQWSIDAVPDTGALTDGQRHFLRSLVELREQRDNCLARPATTYIDEIIQTLELRSDPYGYFDIDPSQRVANLDALVETLNEWETDERYSPDKLIELVDPFRENTHLGPSQPSTSDTTHDVEFRTVHDMKGDQDDVVVVANPGFSVWKYGPQAQRLMTQGSVAGLAPPTDIDTQLDTSLPIFTNGIYDPADTRDRDVGLRWATNHWCDDVVASGDTSSLVGPDRLNRGAARKRAEAWRLLYVALTRACDHLIIPLPRSLQGEQRPRDRWLDTIRDGLQFSGEESGTYSVDTVVESNDGQFDVGVNNVPLDATWTDTSSPRCDDVGVNTTRRGDLESWVPRFVNPSTLYQLTDDPESQVINHLLGTSLHTDTHGVPDDLDLQFDQLGPDDVGTCLHEVLTTLVDKQLSEDTLRSMGKEVRDVFDRVVANHTTGIDTGERERLFEFFEDEVLEDFIDSELWTQIQRADQVNIEVPIDGLVTVDDIEIELHGTVDFVLESDTGERYVADIKITLAEITEEISHRYQLQVAAYAYIFEQRQPRMLTEKKIETFGVKRTTTDLSWPSEIVERRLTMLVQE